jgi:chromosome segregation ATPase
MSNNTNEQHVEDEAAKLFAQITGNDSTKDSRKLDEEQPQDNEATEQAEQGAENQDEQDDPWQSAPETLRKQFQELQQANHKLTSDFQSVHNRLAPTQRELEALKKQLNEKAAANNEKQSANPPTLEDLDGMTDAEIEEDFPELAAVLRKRDKQFQEKFNTLELALNEKLSPLQELKQQAEQEKQQQFIQSELSRVAAKHPDYQKIVNDPSWINWFNAQPQAIKDVAKSLNADDNIALLDLYKSQTKTRAQPKNTLSDHVVLPRKGSGKPMSNYDDVDPAELFQRITS